MTIDIDSQLSEVKRLLTPERLSEMSASDCDQGIELLMALETSVR